MTERSKDQPELAAEWSLSVQRCFTTVAEAVAEHQSNITVTCPPLKDQCYGDHILLYNTSEPAPILDTIDQFISSKRLDECHKILDSFFSIKGDLRQIFIQHISPFFKDLRSVLTKRAFIVKAPFREFAQHAIGVYLSSVLGTRDSVASIFTEKVGCGGCADCARLDKFLASQQKVDHFRRHQSIRNHLKLRLQKAMDEGLVNVSMMHNSRPISLVVTKHPEVWAVHSWEGRLAAVQTFLDNVGPTVEIQHLMGNRYPDVLAALGGNQAFAWDMGWLKQQREFVATAEGATDRVEKARKAAGLGARSGLETEVAGRKRKFRPDF